MIDDILLFVSLVKTKNFDKCRRSYGQCKFQIGEFSYDVTIVNNVKKMKNGRYFINTDHFNFYIFVY